MTFRKIHDLEIQHRVHRGARRKPGEFNIGSCCESLLPILRVLCALCVLRVEFCRHRRIRSSENT